MLYCNNPSSKDESLQNHTKLQKAFQVKNDKGLHTRPSTELVKCACSFEAHINLIFEETVVNAKSILGILMLAATKGSWIKVEAYGKDAQEAIDAILNLAEQKFNINY